MCCKGLKEVDDDEKASMVPGSMEQARLCSHMVWFGEFSSVVLLGVGRQIKDKPECEELVPSMKVLNCHDFGKSMD